MPTYEYLCKKCGKHFERSQRIVDDPLTTCPLDGCSGRVTRLVSGGSGVIFRGSGFYETDYRRKGSDGDKKPAEPCPAAESKACPNSESCPAAAPKDG